MANGPVSGLGLHVGPYKLLEKIGEGGMGRVFMAEQSRPLRRRIALKIIKPGMDMRQVIAALKPSGTPWHRWITRISRECMTQVPLSRAAHTS